jgi:uncharacterized repeat protein (TIGR01451 family)
MQKQPRSLSARYALATRVCSLWLTLAALSCSNPQTVDEPEVEVGKLAEGLFSNGDFETGPANSVPTGWTLNSYLNGGADTSLPAARSKLTLNAGGTAQTRALYSAAGAESQVDTSLTSAGSLRWPKFGNYATYINMNTGKDANVNALRQTMTLGVRDVDPYDGKPHIRFAVAPVLENPSHPANQQPYYFVQLKNTTTNTVLFTEFHVSAEAGVPWKIANSVYYTDWQLKDISPTSVQAALGDSVELEVMAAGCSPGGHYGRVYVDGVGATIPGLSVAASAPSAANTSANINYDIVFKNGGTGAAGNVVIDFNTPPNTTFTSVSAPGAVCTAPASGVAGLVSCTYGLLEPGANNSLRIVARINSNATGTITAGNYQISANNASALLGSTVYTTVTSGVTYTDVTVTNTNNVGAVNWGQNVTYVIVATNNGPAPVANGTMVDTLPNILTGATWTCAGTGGGTCAASGNGNINDGTVFLPVGAAVTYTLNAALVASGTDTRLRNTATFNLPGTMADSQSADNAVADVDPITTTASLTVNKAGNATGTVVSVPNAINCGPSCTTRTSTFAQNQELVLAATPASGKVFTGWSGGGCTGTGNCTITLASATIVTATFDSPPTCSADSQCSSTRYCDGTTSTCQARLPNGASIPNDGIHAGTCASMGSSCSSLLCNANKCAKSAGASCSAGSECASNTCTSNVCAAMANGSQCGVNSDCTSGSCKSQRCVASSSGCWVDSECSSGQYCNRSIYTCATKLDKGTAIPSDGLHGGTCSDAAAVCLSGLCNSSSSTCGVANGGDCSSANQCQNNTCSAQHCVPASNGCWVDSNCATGNYCNRGTMTCTPKLTTGTAIPNDGLHGGTCSDAGAVCQSGLCNSSTSTCAANNGTMCSNANTCVSNTCKSGRCVPAASGCYEDVNCSAGTYCNRAQLTCVNKLSSGSQLPSDTLHTGVCSPSEASAVCQSSKCNSNANSCASDNGTVCAANAACVNDTCTSMHCVPQSNGCWVDGDCASGYCDRATLSCVPKRAAGASIPNDGLHNGTCTPDNGLAVCSSGECNTSSNTCASAFRTACTNANQCVSNTCTSMRCVPAADGCFVDSDCPTDDKYCNRTNLTCTNKLGSGTPVPDDGLHGGTCADALAVCRSGTCNATTNTCGVTDGSSCNTNAQCINNTCTSEHCVPASNGCWIDGDCQGETYCDRSSLTCKPKVATGSEIPSDGLHGGSCADAAAVCQSGLCNAQQKTCATANGSSCTSREQCVNDTCTSDHCVPTASGCWVDETCPADRFCNRSNLSCVPQLTAGVAIPDDGLHGGMCDAAVAVCVTDRCNSTTRTCALDNGASCSAANQCVNNTCTSAHCVAASNGCWLDSDCPGSAYCDRSTYQCKPDIADGGRIPRSDDYHSGTCSDAAAVCVSGKCNATTTTCASDTNTTCTMAAQCTVNVCDPNGKCGISDGAAGCLPSNGATTCQSGTCVPSGRCVPPGGNGCYADSDCASDKYCERSSLQCKPKLSDGTAIPRDTLHDGRCTQPNAQAVCQSGGCNAVTNTCASNNGVSCTMANQCIRNICGSNGLCGYADGSGPCTQANGKFVCQSGACSSTGSVCVPAISKSCAADSDCPQSDHCDGLNGQCVADLSNGQSIPSDGLHNGVCSQQNASAVCTSGHCNATTNQCAAARGAGCITRAECEADVCENGKCGRADGAGPCTQSNAAVVCQSGSCSQDGTCLVAGQCKIDSDCLPDRFCDRTRSQCSARLPAGSPIPTDGYHTGTCPSTGLTPVCASGSCSTDTNRCVVENNTACSMNNECSSGSCGTNNKCGLAAQETGCTPGADSACQSGVCGNDSACAQSASCASDAACAANNGFCSDGSCLPRLASGSHIPEDALHAGDCTDQNAAAVCESGLCNATTATCAEPSNIRCGVAAQCASNLCGSNGRCGLPNGQGPCTPSNAAQTCQSLTCSASSSTCIPSNGCGNDNDCAADKYCDGGTYRCVATLSPGSVLPDDGLHSRSCTDQNARVCQSGACNPYRGTCALENEESCTGPAECTSNLCVDGKCGAPNGSGHCTSGEASQCRSGTCSASSLVCIPQTKGCASPNDCSTSEYCDVQTYTCKPRVANGQPLPDGAGCPGSGVTRDCASGLCVQDESRCVAPLNAACSDDAQCQSGECGQNNLCGVEDGGTCAPGNSNQCQSQSCGSGGTCNAARSCNADAQCLPGSYCDGLFCRPKLNAGSSVADDGLHDGKCTPENAQATCASGACNDSSDTCAGSFNAPCADATGCVANACGADGKCGYDVGEGHCTSMDATTVCRTGLCSVVGVCLPSQTSGCAVDSDCGSGTYCDLHQNTCVPKLSDGTPLPNDGLHDGMCTLQSGAIVCASGACNAVANTCARANGSSCSSRETCVSDVCGSNGLCGIAEGDGTCTTSTAKLCQSNRCSSQGVCVRADNGCAVDSDCSSSTWCDPAARTCKPKLAAGSALPNDTLHSGACSSSLASAVCQTGQCNTQRKTCAAINGTSCNAANKCVSDACGDNGRCGLAVGQTGCTSTNQAQLCQSTFCSASGVCVPPTGCNLDSDCASGKYCNRTAHVCDAQLRDGRVLPKDALHDGMCTAELAAIVCASGACNTVANTCAAQNSVACSDASQCVSNACGDNRLCGLTDGKGPCADNTQCQSSVCQDDSGRCVASELGCTRDADCAEDMHCNTRQLRCEPDLDDGSELPDDSDSGGRCTTEVAKVCASGACNPETDTCAAVGGKECSEDAQCASNSCTEGVCGSPDGRGECTQENAASKCQSGICQADLSRCVAVRNGCSADGDCPPGNYCDGRSLACVARLAPGAKLPADDVHSDVCSDEVAAAVCDSGACNARTNACALVVGMPCAQASECASNACLGNACVPSADAPTAFRLTGGRRCSVTWVQAGSIGPTLALLALAAVVLRRRRERTRRKR